MPAGARRSARHFIGDASARSYEIVTLAGQAPRVLMNSPRLVLGPPVRDGKPYAEIAHTAQSVAAFVAIDRALAGRRRQRSGNLCRRISTRAFC